TFYAPASQTPQPVTRREELVQRITTQLTRKEAPRSSSDQLLVAAISPGLCLHNLGSSKRLQYSLNIRWICRRSSVLVSASISRMRAFCTFRLSPTTKSY